MPFPHIDIKYQTEPIEFMFYPKYIFLCTHNFKKVVVGVNGNENIIFVSLAC
jgi:hypothetical protein